MEKDTNRQFSKEEIQVADNNVILKHILFI